MKVARNVLVTLLVFLLFAGPLSAGKRAKKFWRTLTGVERLGQQPDRGALASSVDLDDVSAGCMTCHDGSGGRRIVIKHPDAPLHIRGFRTEDHPVGMDYHEYADRDPRGFTPIQLLDPRLVLVDGKVSCASCHAVKVEEPVVAE